MNPTRILVTGGAGFIGSHTVDLLLKQNKEVVVLDNLSSGKIENLNLRHPNLEFIEGDILEYPLIVDLLRGCDAVLHLAAIVSVPESLENPIYSFQVNTQGFLHILQAVRKTKRKIRIVYASSAAVYGDLQGKAGNDALPLLRQPLSPYALQKTHDEDYADLYHRIFNVGSLGLRYFNVYGPRQAPDSPYSGVISRFIKAFKQKETLTVFGDGQQTRDFIYVADVAMANCLALQSQEVGTLNVATGNAQTLLNLIQLIEERGEHKAQIRFESERAGDIKFSEGATHMAKERLQFRSLISLKEGLQLMLK